MQNPFMSIYLVLDLKGDSVFSIRILKLDLIEWTHFDCVTWWQTWINVDYSKKILADMDCGDP